MVTLSYLKVSVDVTVHVYLVLITFKLPQF